MLQAPVNYYQPQMQAQAQPSYNAVKIDIHNPKVTDACPQYPSAYGMPVNPYYTYPQAQTIPYYPVMPTVPQYQPQPMPMPQPVMPQIMPQPVPQPLPQPIATCPCQTVVPQPVPQVPVQQVINNGVPAQQTIQQTPVPQPPVQTITNPVIANTVPQTVNTPVPTIQVQPQNQTPVQIVEPMKTIVNEDITPVLKGLQSNNMAEQSAALSKIGDVAEKPQEVKKYLETSVLDSILNILNADTSKLAPATKEQIEARTKLMNGQQLSDAEKNLAMTLAPQEFADRNKQHALYSLAILQKSLAEELEAKTGEKLSIEKLPAIDQVVNTVKANPNPLLRASALVALAHLNKPEYKPVLSEIFQLAQHDKDPNVKQVAGEALNKINGVQQPQN